MSTVLGVLVVLALCLALLRFFAADVYDLVIVWMTARWYQAVFQRLNKGDRLLDVGIGTASALVRSKAEMLTRRVSVVGIDYEAAYVRKAEAVLKASGLWQAVPAGTEGYRPGEFYCHVLERSIYDNLNDLCLQVGDEPFRGEVPSEVPEDQRFDAVYFSGSFSVLPDPPAALEAVLPLMKRDGRVFLTQTFQKAPSPMLACLKPLAKYITTIDFGQLITEVEIERLISSAKSFEVLENRPIPGSIDTQLQTARLIILKPKPKKPKA
ncbi:unnamed protein product [Symbiodinium pilosum]|uniref:Methyltransferase domain-containing protein n=1 Tax=Symbiodinium pilosum TaxID=2952 RepID=A0A812YJP9_SYMPI|nr:unnamed protein product [Symbiodinium pilosum]